MPRIKKSRKPSSAPTAKPKLSKKELANVEKRVRKRKGKQAGNRQQEAQNKQASTLDANQNKDPRLGSKKPIVLEVNTTNKTVQKPKSNKNQSAVAPILVIDKEDVDQQALIQELEAIEENNDLQNILAKQEQGLSLSNEEVDFYNQQMARHQELSELLGYEEEVDEDSADTTSEDDLWNKLDSSDLSDY